MSISRRPLSLSYLQSAIHLILLTVLLCLASESLYAQKGQPFISNFSPISYSSNEYISSPQNWCIEKDPSGKVIVANTSGLLIYDGVDWHMVPETEGKVFYKIAKDLKGRIYTGGDGEIGFLKPNAKGEMRFVSLLDKMKEGDRDFGRINNIVVFEGDIFFKSITHLIRYSKGAFKVWKPQNKFLKLVSSSAGLFVSEPSHWFRFEKETLQEIASSKDSDLPNMRAVFEGPNDTLLVVSRSSGLFYLHNGKYSALPLNIDSVTIINACQVAENNIALSTNEMGVVIINNQGIVLEVINESIGLNSNGTIFSHYSESQLWVAMQKGISLIEYPASTSVLNKKNGLNSFPIRMARFKNRLFVGAYENSYWIDKKPITNEGILTPHAKQLKEVFGLIKVGDQLAVANTNGLLIISENGKSREMQRPNNFPCSALIKSSKYENAIYACYRDVIVRSFIDDKSEASSNPITLGHPVYSMAEESDGNLWAVYDGISYIDFSNGSESPIVTTFDASNGLSSEMGFIEVTSVKGNVVFGTELGVYSFNHKTKKLVPNPIFGKEFCDGSHMAYNLTEMRNGDVWVTSTSNTGILRKQKDNSFVFDSLVIVRAQVSDVWGIYEDDDNIVWISGTEAIIRYDPSKKSTSNSPYRSFIRSVVINDSEKIFAGNYSNKEGYTVIKQPKSYVPTLDYSENNISFSFGAVSFATDVKLEYSVKLVGKDDKWSSWKKGTERNYNNLSEGHYTFKVRTRKVYGKVYGKISEEASYSFIILPPWYRTTWAYILFIVSGLLILLLIVRLNTLKLRRDKRILEGVVTDRTAEVLKQKDEIIEQTEQLQEAYSRLVELANFKVSMTSMIVHDLKNPLNVIINTLLDDATEEQLNKIKQSGRQMLTMVLNILDVYKYENSEMKIDKVPVELEKLVKDTLGEITFLAQQQSIQVNVDLKESVTVIGDWELLSRVLVNLLTNAIKFSPTMSVIELNGSIVKNRFRMEIRDQGTGIGPEDLATIFDKYKQVTSTDSGGVRSTGLGLTFCKIATEAHGGTIGVESEFGKGSCFWFELPIPEGALVQTVLEPIGDVKTPQIVLSEEALAFLMPYAEKLKSIPYYKISELRQTIHAISPPESIELAINKWVEQFKEAAALADRDLIDKLIHDILDESTEEL